MNIVGLFLRRFEGVHSKFIFLDASVSVTFIINYYNKGTVHSGESPSESRSTLRTQFANLYKKYKQSCRSMHPALMAKSKGWSCAVLCF